MMVGDVVYVPERNKFFIIRKVLKNADFDDGEIYYQVGNRTVYHSSKIVSQEEGWLIQMMSACRYSKISSFKNKI